MWNSVSFGTWIQSQNYQHNQDTYIFITLSPRQSLIGFLSVQFCVFQNFIEMKSNIMQHFVWPLLLSKIFFLMLFLSAYILFMYVCMYVWLCWVFVPVRGPSLVVASGGHPSSRCAGLSPSRPLVAEHRLQMRRLSSCGSRAELLRGMWDLPRPGLEPASPALAGRFSTTAPPGKPSKIFLRLLMLHF